MYQIIIVILIIAFLCSIFLWFRKKKICKMLVCMSIEEKCSMITPLIEPFGYCYEPCNDTFSTTIDAPQRIFGYTSLFDLYAPHFNMVFDCMPIYFDYNGRTWLIEFWKGQYGINIGCEVGIYKADSIVASIQQNTTLFHSVKNEEMLPMSISLYHNDKKISHLSKKHWWLTAFHMGCYCEPKDLVVQVCITFPNAEMLAAFVNSLNTQVNIAFHICGLQVKLLFNDCSSCRLTSFRKFICRFAQWRNRILCRMFLWVTKPFKCSLDRLLCLYLYLPPLFWHTVKNKKRKKCYRKSQRRIH